MRAGKGDKSVTAWGFKTDLNSRIMGLALSAAFHLAVGVAMVHANKQGAPLRGPSGGDAGQILFVELIPLDRSGGPRGDRAADHGGVALVETPLPSPSSATNGTREPVREPRASGAATSDLSASSENQGDTRQMSDLPSSEVLAYRQRLESHLARYRIFPAGARSAGREGVVTVYFNMTREGRVLDAWVETSSGAGDLDAEALSAILRAQPLPLLPQSWPDRIDVSLPVTFRLG